MSIISSITITMKGNTGRKSTTPTKKIDKATGNQQNQTLVFNSCIKILLHEDLEDINKWFIENKITSAALKNEKTLMVLTHSDYVANQLLINKEDSSLFLTYLINHYRGNARKCFEYCRCLKHFASRDYQFDYIYSMAKGDISESVSFYLRCKTAIVDSFVNKYKREQMSGVIGSAEQWLTACRQIFKNVKTDELVEVFTDISKAHYLQIKKNQNEDLRGDEFFKVCILIRRHLREREYDGKDAEEEESYYVNEPGQSSQIYKNPGAYKQPTHSEKEGEVKRLFDKRVIEGLQSEDRELIRMLSYRDTNIARLLEKKHEKMIDLIAEEVDQMRSNIDEERKKYLELHREKEEVLAITQKISKLALLYLKDPVIGNEEKLLSSIQNFSQHYGRDHQNISRSIKSLRQDKKHERLIELIEMEERELD